jgi:tRNA pseudouridine55 synthase
MNAFLVIDKPAGVTSHDVVAAVRAVTGVSKVGHTGTLDPFATGVLALALGSTTRLVQYLDESLKIYDATVKFGTATDTGDPTGEAIRTLPVPVLDVETVERVLAGYVGDRMQTPPPYSAVKVRGKPLYYYARRGEVVEVPARPITIYDLKLLELHEDGMRIEIHCSRGTYARVIADELATELGTAGHLAALSRRRSGPFALDDALTMDDLAKIVSEEEGAPWDAVLMSRGRSKEDRVSWRQRDDVRADLAKWLRTPLAALSHLPMLDVDEASAQRVRQGSPVPGLPGGVSVGGRFLIVHGSDVVAVAEATSEGAKTLRVVGEERETGRRRRRRRA